MKKLYYKINFKLDWSKLGGSKFPNPLRSQYHIFKKPKPGSSTGCIPSQSIHWKCNNLILEERKFRFPESSDDINLYGISEKLNKTVGKKFPQPKIRTKENDWLENWRNQHYKTIGYKINYININKNWLAEKFPHSH